MFAYQVEIINEGEATVQLLNRHWIITDAKGEVEEVRHVATNSKLPEVKISSDLWLFICGTCHAVNLHEELASHEWA